MDRVYLSGASGSTPVAPASPSTGFPTAGIPGVTPAAVQLLIVHLTRARRERAA